MHFDLTANGADLRGTVQLSDGDNHASANLVLRRVEK